MKLLSLPPHERREIAARAICPERTVRNVYENPFGHRPSTVARITRAALELGLPPPGGHNANLSGGRAS